MEIKVDDQVLILENQELYTVIVVEDTGYLVVQMNSFLGTNYCKELIHKSEVDNKYIKHLPKNL